MGFIKNISCFPPLFYFMAEFFLQNGQQDKELLKIHTYLEGPEHFVWFWEAKQENLLHSDNII